MGRFNDRSVESHWPVSEFLAFLGLLLWVQLLKSKMNGLTAGDKFHGAAPYRGSEMILATLGFISPLVGERFDDLSAWSRSHIIYSIARTLVTLIDLDYLI